jgi:hypothetical protein
MNIDEPLPPDLKPPKANLPAARTSNGFIAAASGLPPPVGCFLRHDGKKGGWTLDGVPISESDRWLAQGPRYGWKYLEAGKKAEDYPEELGKPFRHRSELPHQDQRLWPISRDTNQPVDPVKQYVTIDFTRLADGAYATYEAMARSAMRAVNETIRTIGWQTPAHHPLARPVMKLGSRVAPSRYGEIHVPVLTIVAWAIPGADGQWRVETPQEQPTIGEVIDDGLPENW